MEKSNQTIKYNVSNYKYNDDNKYLCTLDKIDVACTCKEENCHTKNDTICNSFHEKK